MQETVPGCVLSSAVAVTYVVHFHVSFVRETIAKRPEDLFYTGSEVGPSTVVSDAAGRWENAAYVDSIASVSGSTELTGCLGMLPVAI